MVAIHMDNDGRILSDDELMHSLKAGWSTKSASGNHAKVGMGLYMCSKIIRLHRGSLRIGNLPDKSGVRVEVMLPLLGVN